MEEFKPIDFYDESTNLHFHKANPQKHSGDDHFFVTLNTWNSEAISKFVLPNSCLPLGSAFNRNARLGDDLYIVQNDAMEVVGATLLDPISPIYGTLDLCQYFMAYKNNREATLGYLSLKNTIDLLEKKAKGIYIRAFAVDPTKTGQGFGTKILNAITQNSTILNRNVQPVCTMAMVKETNEFSKKAFENADFKTIPVDYENYYKFYYMHNSNDIKSI